MNSKNKTLEERIKNRETILLTCDELEESGYTKEEVENMMRQAGYNIWSEEIINHIK